jgi:UDP-N-acetylmuramoylalanine--D-glutamate ligase
VSDVTELSTLPEADRAPGDDDAARLAAEQVRAAALEAERAAHAQARAEALALASERAALGGRRVLVVGLGESGLAIARWAALHGATVTVADTRAEPPGRAALGEHCPAARFVAGELSPALLEGVDLVGWSQGLSPVQGPAAGLYAAARAAGVAVWGELEFFARAFALRRAQGDDARLVAITGTNGKTTTTRLLGHLCEQAGLEAVVCGNISPAALDALREAQAGGQWPRVWVLEAASYQLALADSFAPDAAAVLNVTQDHLDWHGTMPAYAAAKQRIYAPGTACVYNRDDPATVPGAGAAPADGAPPRAGRGPGRAARREPARATLSFGLDAPGSAGSFGRVRDGGIDWLAEAVVDEDALPSRRRRDEATAVRVVRLMPADALRIRGAHNQANVLAALALARAVGVPMAAMLHGLRAFAGEPHRCELVAAIDVVDWYDDSKGTNVGATVAALAGLGKPVVLIAGGDGKGQDFAPLAPAVARHAVAVLLIGRDAPRIRAALEGTGVPLHDCPSLEDAVDRAARLAAPGSAVLLSPACASFDMFRNYAHRAEVFAAAVRTIAEAGGQPC